MMKSRFLRHAAPKSGAFITRISMTYPRLSQYRHHRRKCCPFRLEHCTSTGRTAPPFSRRALAHARPAGVLHFGPRTRPTTFPPPFPFRSSFSHTKLDPPPLSSRSHRICVSGPQFFHSGTFSIMTTRGATSFIHRAMHQPSM